MKALVYTQPHEMQLQERDAPALDADEVLLRIDAVGICGSDMHAYHGHDPRRKPGLVLGHELSGTVLETRSPRYAVGQRVTANPLITCGVCEYCVQGRNNLCAHRTMVGMTRPGAFAEMMSIPASSVIDMPQTMNAVHAALTEPAATALHAIALSARALARPIAECRVLVIGGGAIGILAALLLHHYGCRDIDVVETNAKRRATIARHTQARALDPAEITPPESHYHYVIDAVGAKPTRTVALNAIKPGGVVMHIGLQDWASEIDMRKLTLAEITLMGTYTYTTADLRATVAMIASGAFGDLSWVVTRPLAQGAAAFAELDRGEQASPKVVLLPEHA